MSGHVFRRSSALHCNAGWPACHLGGAAGVSFFFRVFTTVSSVRSDDIRFFCSGLLDCGSLSTCVLISLFSGWCAALVAVCSKLTSRHVSPIQTTFCGTLFTRTEHPHATRLAPGLALVAYPSQQYDATISIFSRLCPTPHVHFLNRKLTSGCEKKSCHIAMQRAIGLAQISHTTMLIIAVHRCPLNKTTGSDPITLTLTSTTSSSTVQLCPFTLEGYPLQCRNDGEYRTGGLRLVERQITARKKNQKKDYVTQASCFRKAVGVFSIDARQLRD
jgi:hypothetical protein